MHSGIAQCLLVKSPYFLKEPDEKTIQVTNAGASVVALAQVRLQLQPYQLPSTPRV